MNAKEIKFLRLDSESDEDELVFEVIPNSGDGVYTKNRWLLRVAKCFVDINEKGVEDKDIGNMVTRAKEQIGLVMGIKE